MEELDQKKENMDALSILVFNIFGKDTEDKQDEMEEEEIETVDINDVMSHFSIAIMFGQFCPVTRVAFDEGVILFLAKDPGAKEMKIKKWDNFTLSDYELTEEDKAAEDWILL